MQCFMQDDTKRLLWSAPLFNDGKVDSYDEKAAAEYLCHLERPGKWFECHVIRMSFISFEPAIRVS